MEEPAEDGEVHGLGESAAPLISTAVYNACGVRIKDLLVIPEKVLCELVAFREGRATAEVHAAV